MPRSTRRVALARAAAGDAEHALDLIEPLLATGAPEPDVQVLAVKLAIALAAGNTSSDHAGDLARLQRYNQLLAQWRRRRRRSSATGSGISRAGPRRLPHGSIAAGSGRCRSPLLVALQLTRNFPLIVGW